MWSGVLIYFALYMEFLVWLGLVWFVYILFSFCFFSFYSFIGFHVVVDFCFFLRALFFCFVVPLVFFYAWQSPPPAPSGAAGGGGAVRGADSQAAVDGRRGPAPARHHRAAGGRPASLTPGPASPHGICRLGSVPADVSCQKTNPHPEGSSHLEL